MKRVLGIARLILVAGSSLAVAQALPPAPPSGQDSLAAGLNAYAFPQKGQTPSMHSQNEAAVSQGAVRNTGKHPFELPMQAQTRQAASTQDITNFKKAFSACLRKKGAMGTF